jgi:hypothetical protein
MFLLKLGNSRAHNRMIFSKENILIGLRLQLRILTLTFT